MSTGTRDYVMAIEETSGNVGIGTTAPDMPLQVKRGGTTGAIIGVGQTGTGVARVYMDASNGDFSGGDYMWIGQNNDLSGEIQMTQNAGAFNIRTQPSGTLTTRFTVLQNGNIGIGTTSPSEPLEVVGVISSADSGLQKSTFSNVGNDLVLVANAGKTLSLIHI